MYNVGDKVRIVKDTKGMMSSRKRYLGAVMTIKGMNNTEYFDTTYNRFLYGLCYRMEEDKGLFLWPENTIEGLVEDVAIGKLSVDNGVHIINW